jgi:hypothetical protein
MTEALEGIVARLITDDELLINLGSEEGVEVGYIFKVLDPRTQNVNEPVSGRDLGSIERVKAMVAVVSVSEHLALARKHPRRGSGLSATARLLSGEPVRERLTSDTWPEGVAVQDPVVFANRRLEPPKQ